MNTWLSDDRTLETLFRGSPSGIVALDRDGCVLASNATFTRISGFAEADLAGQSLRESDRLALRTLVEDALSPTNGETRITRNVEFERADGATVWCEVTAITVENGEVRLFLVFHDITWRAAGTGGAAAEIGQLRANFRLLFEHNPSIVMAVDRDTRITDVNPAGLRTSGYAREEVIGKSVTEFVPPSQRDRLRLFLGQALRGETVSFPIDAYTADGRLNQYEATTLPIISRNRVVGIYGLLENVTERMRAERTVAAQREELIDLESDFRSLFDNNPDGIVLLSADGDVLDVNEAAARISKYPKEALLGRNLRAFVEGQSLERASNFLRRAASGEAVRYDIAVPRGDGHEVILDVTLFPKYAQGVAVAVYCLMQDITERRLAQRKSEMQAQRIRDLYLLATAPEYTESQFMSTLQTGCRLLGMESGAIVESNDGIRIDVRYDSLEIFAGEDDRVIDLARAALERKEPVVSHAGENGEATYKSWIGSRLMVGGNIHGVLLFFSRTKREQHFEEVDLDTLALMSALISSALERHRARSRLRTLAYYDALTGLPNRAYFQERLRDALLDLGGKIEPLAVLFFDLDRFKDINDTLGHAMGDRFLQMVAHRLTRCVGDEGIVARMGGDEFIVLVPKCESIEQTHALADRLLHAIEEPFRIQDYEQYITTSIGVAVFPNDGRDDQTLIKNADIAMYEVKDQGGNGCMFYNDSLEAPIRTRLAQEKLLRRAIEREEFTLHFQTIVDVATEDVVGVEALVRWQDPQRGLVYPDEFIPTAEASGLIVRLGEWIVKAAASQVREWQQRFSPLCLAVNISPRQFFHPNLCERLADLLEQSQLDPGFVEVEITESMAIADVSHAVQTVRKLKQLGAHVGVDDFGTGHSSLNYLRRFDVDHLKIDRSFIAGIGSEHSDETIVKAIIALGHSLGLKIVAEGVETRAQLEFLRQHGCERAQGYLFSRPLDPAALEPLLAKARGTPGGPG